MKSCQIGNVLQTQAHFAGARQATTPSEVNMKLSQVSEESQAHGKGIDAAQTNAT